MQRLAVLLTCFNRKDKTIAALTALKEAFKKSNENWQMSIYLTDDGSTDGTSQAVATNFPDVHILKGTGFLYWAGGMRNSWKEAVKGDYDAYLLINDDTNIYPHLFDSIKKTHEFCMLNYEMGGVYIGTTVDSETKKITYGGSVFINRFLAKMKRVQPKESPTPCHLGNANIMWVCKNVVDDMGILSDGYVHGMADYDYTLRATKKGIPSLIMPGVVGECINDHNDPYLKFFKLSLKERFKMLYNPVGFDFVSQSHHMKKHFPIRFPLFIMTGYFKVFFPKIYYHLLYKNRKN
ncbi:glycosyltransferase family 2 protein [Flagellimonas aquimarina]|uniref:Glycosyltransferase family 2 protein n=1 Tax=Flagellimonas aquimarina TaxID=2201895 RepID=A0A316LGC0_9FLAO|nr:glycosyltransferase [Allomuricauda koreensis]PWL39150.1 glycosyltransferase family 2 protein [Allomuricauda koreensis]